MTAATPMRRYQDMMGMLFVVGAQEPVAGGQNQRMIGKSDHYPGHSLR